MIIAVLVAIATVLIVMCCVAVGGCAWAWQRHLGRRHVHARLSQASHGRIDCCGPARRPRIEERRETRLEALQRRFVSGQITLDEYERDIDSLQQLA